MISSNFLANFYFRRAQHRRALGRIAAAHLDLARAARRGLASAQHELARSYQHGDGCTRSGAVAERWYRAASLQGHVDSQFELGLILLSSRDTGWAGGPSSSWLKSRGAQEADLAADLFMTDLANGSDPNEALIWLLRAAEAGKAEAQANVGWLYLTGLGCDRDFVEAHRWLSAAATRNVSQAALGLSEFFASSDPLIQDHVASASWAKRASELGNGSGSYRYATALKDGLGVEKDIMKAEQFFSLAIEQHHPTAAFELAVLVLSRDARDDEAERVIERLRECAKQNHCPSSMLLAEVYERGLFQARDYHEALSWYRRAADLGNAQAQFMAGCLLARGEGVVMDTRQAAKYFKLAAERNHPNAAYNLAMFHLNGEGVEKNLAEARSWFKLAADTGFAPAELHLGQIMLSEALSSSETDAAKELIKNSSNKGYARAKVALAHILLTEVKSRNDREIISLLEAAVMAGEVDAAEILLFSPVGDFDVDLVSTALMRLIEEGNVSAKLVLARAFMSGVCLPQNPSKAVKLLNEAAISKNAEAHFLLGVIYCQGSIVAKDIHKGFSHYQGASRLGHPVAKYNVGVMLLNGIGVSQDTDAGLEFIKEAADLGFQAAINHVRDAS